MKLIGMLDSPYVRRVAVSLQFLKLKFEHQSLSVFRTFDQFRAINPVVKAPTLVCDDGTVLMDSTLILEYAERLAAPRSLVPKDPVELAQVLRLTGLALAACEKSVQIYYEYNTRPQDKVHLPWVERATGQLHAAYAEIEKDLCGVPLAANLQISQASISIAVAWTFTQKMLPGVVAGDAYPSVVAFCAAAESLPEFVKAPFGNGTYTG